MKINFTITFLLALASTSLFAQLPKKADELISKLSNWELNQQAELKKEIHAKRAEVATHLETLLNRTTKSGDLDGALAIESEISRLKAEDLHMSLLELIEGKWEWNTGSKGEFRSGGKDTNDKKVLWVIDPGARLLFLRADPDWHYEIRLSADGDSFTAKRIQSGKEYSAKRLSK